MTKSSNLVLVVILFLAVTAVGVLLWSGGGSGEDYGPDAPLIMADEALESAEAEDAAAELGFDVGAEAEEEVAADEFARTEVAFGEHGRALMLQVWHGQAGVPAAGAEVFVMGRPEGGGRRDPFAEHWTAVCEDQGERFEADAQGWVELPPVRDRVMVVARGEGAFGFARLDQDHEEVETITLQRDETVTVRVVDGAGNAVVDAPVGIVQSVPERANIGQLEKQLNEAEGHIARVENWMKRNPEQRERALSRIERLNRWQTDLSGQLEKAREAELRMGPQHNSKQSVIVSRYELRARRHTDVDGFALFRHFQIFRHEAKEWWPVEHSNQFEAALLMPTALAQTVPFYGRPAPAGVIELRMPPTGSIALRTIDRDGRPFTHPVHGELRAEGMESMPWMRIPVRKAQGEESVLFPFVGLGLRFSANCRLDDEDFRWQVPTFSGPTSPGDHIVIDLVVAPEQGMLIGRLLDEEGRALAGAETTFLINSEAGRLEGEEVLLDEEGRFHLPYKLQRRHQPPYRLEIRHERPGPTAGLAMKLDKLPEAQVTDLGDLHLDALAAIARGRVVDDRGQPVADARLRLQKERPSGRDGKRQFADEAFNQTRSAVDGSYELFGDLEPGRYRMRVEAKDHFRVDTPELAAGEVVDVRMQRRSRVLGTVLAPEWMSRKGLRVQLLSAVDGKQIKEDQIRDYEGRTYIHFDWIWPGRYDLMLRVREFPDPFLVIRDIEIVAGQQDLHPRLTDLDLGAYLYRFEVEAVDREGKRFNPDRPLLSRITRPDGRSGFIGFPWRRGKVEMLSASRQVEVVPLASGRRAEPAVLGPGQSSLSFEKVPVAVVKVPGMGQLVGDTKVQILLEPVGDSELPGKLEKWDRYSGRIAGWYEKTRRVTSTLNAKDDAWFRPTAAGRYRVSAQVGFQSGVKPVSVRLGAVQLQMVPGEKPQRLVVQADPAKIQQAMADLAQRLAAKAAGG